MKILIFNWRDLKHSWAGGGEIYIFEQAKRWVKMGHSVTVFCSQDYYRALPFIEKIDGITIYRRGNRFSVYLWAMWYYFIYFQKRCDVVIDVVNGIPFFTPLFCRKPKICYVYHIHGKQFFYELPKLLSHIGFFIERFIFPFYYKNMPIVAISETTKQQLMQIGFKKKDITIIYCGVNGSTKLSKKTIDKYTNPTLLYLGRIKKYKRVDMLVNIFPHIVKKVPRARLIIAGWGTDASFITNLIMLSPLRRKISLLGPVTAAEKKKLLSKSWLFVNPSIGEGWSIAVIEANLYGTPSIAFNVPGVSESIKPNKTGLLAKNQEDLVEKISSLLTDKKRYAVYSSQALRWAKNFDWEITARQSIKMINRIFHEKK